MNHTRCMIYRETCLIYRTADLAEKQTCLISHGSLYCDCHNRTEEDIQLRGRERKIIWTPEEDAVLTVSEHNQSVAACCASCIIWQFCKKKERAFVCLAQMRALDVHIYIHT
jgi:hypothetical protein